MMETTTAQITKASRLHTPVRRNTSAGRPKIPDPMIVFTPSATRSRRRITRRSPSEARGWAKAIG